MVEDLKVKLQEIVLGDREVLRQFIPSFTKYTIYHKEDSATGSGWTLDRLNLTVTACPIKDMTTAVYKQVYFFKPSCMTYIH